MLDSYHRARKFDRSFEPAGHSLGVSRPFREGERRDLNKNKRTEEKTVVDFGVVWFGVRLLVQSL